jgi:hypothetical protein
LIVKGCFIKLKLKMKLGVREFVAWMMGLAATGLCLLALVAHAAEPSSVGLTVSPPTFELSANPGDVLDNTVRIINESTDAITFEAAVEDFTVTGTEGTVSVNPDASPNAFSKWFSFGQKEFRLESKQSVLVPYRIQVPQNAEPGGHFASVLFRPKSSASPGATGARVVQRVGSLILMRVSGDINEDGRIEKFVPKTFVGEWDEVTGSDGKTKILVAKNEKLDSEQQRRWFERGPVAFDLLVKNNGNVHFKPTGTVTISNLFGRKVATLALDPRNVFPGGERRTTVIWPESRRLWGGFYRAEVTAIYGSQNQVITASANFFGFPKLVIGLILLLLLLLGLLRRRLWKAVRVLIKGS